MKLSYQLNNMATRIYRETTEIMESDRKDSQKKRELVNMYNRICNSEIGRANTDYNKAIIKAYRGFVTLTIAETLPIDEVESLIYVAIKNMFDAKPGSHLEEV